MKHFQSPEYDIRPSTDFDAFYTILEHTLSRHHVKPVHTSAELKLLTERFHSSIFLYALHYKEDIHAFCWMFSTPKVLHIQNMSVSDYGREHHFIDYVYNWVFSQFSKEYDYLSFGVSTENNGLTLNYGLTDQKERFGARGLSYDFYELSFI
jgi:hypothetical protein